MNTLTGIINNPSELDIVTAKSPAKLNSQLPLLKTAKPLISVVIPVYNGSKYIQLAIDSVLEQTYSNYEIIVVDDGSTDDTRQKLQLYQDRVRYVYQNNRGSAAARNVGISLSKGELIAFLDADDFWAMPEKLAKQVAYFNNNPSLGCINTGWKIVDSAGKHLKTVQPWYKAPKLDLETWLKKKCVRTSAMVFRREWLERVGGFDEQLRQSQDVDLILRLSLAGCQTVWLKEATVCYRQHKENTTKNSLKQAKYVQAVLDKFFARDDLPESISIQESQIRYHTLVWVAWYQYRADNLDEMAKFLQKSLDFSPYLRVENISHWLNSFTRFSQDRGEKINIDSLTNSPQWQQLIFLAVGIKSIKSIKSISSSDNTLNTVSKDNHQKIEHHHNFPIVNQKSNKTISNSIPERSANNSLEYSGKIDIELADKYRITGDALLSQGHKSEAINCYQESIAINHNQIEIHRKLATFLREQGDLNGAIASCQNILRLEPKDKEILEKLADALFQRGNDDDISQGIAYYKQVIPIKPNDLNLYFKVLEIEPHDLSSYLQLGQKLIKANKNIQAVILLQVAQKIHPDNQKVQSLLARALERQSQDNSNEFQEILKLNSDDAKNLNFTSAMPFFDIGMSLKQDKKIAEAGICFEKSVALQPDKYKFHHELSNVYREQKEFDKAISSSQKTIELKSDFVWAHHNLGRCYQGIKAINKAVEAYQNALEIDPNLKVSREALNQLLNGQQKAEIQEYQKLAKEKTQAGDLEEAKVIYEQAIALESNNHDLHHNLGDILRKLGNIDGAIAEAQKTIEIRPDFYWGHHNLGRALELKGLSDKAIKAYQNALSIKPDLTVSKDNLEKLLNK